LFIPLLFDADWFFYHDDDVFFRRGPVFPSVLAYARGPNTALLAVHDSWWNVSTKLRPRIRAYRPTQDAYFGSGFLVMRNSEILHRELRNTINYVIDHMELTFLDQDGLNLGFDWRHIELLPKQFCVTSSEHRQTWDFAFGFHFIGPGKHTNCFVRAVTKVYGEQRDEWMAIEPRHKGGFPNRSHVMPDQVVRVLNWSLGFRPISC
jgi:hypothetical protein